MKIIISRKGFDSERGGYPSPILPDGRMISLPIPIIIDKICYNDLKINYKNYKTYYDLMVGLGINEPTRVVKKNGKNEIEKFKLNKKSKCHLDPDIYKNILKRRIGWRPIFGQVGAAQSHLHNQKIKEGDIFLFFGTFQKTIYENDGLIFDPDFDEKHIIFGYLQIGEKKKIDTKTSYYSWIENHPHTLPKRKKETNNTVYIARDILDFADNIPGAGVFAYNKTLVLTKENHQLSQWALPHFFKETVISYHPNKNKCWQRNYFQSVGRGQEFVIKANNEVKRWVNRLIKRNVKNIN